MKIPNEAIEAEPLYLNNDHFQDQAEVNLWRAVIKQAFDDLYLPPSNKKYRFWRKQAIKWFSEPNKDFYTICEYAKVSSEEIHKHALKKILLEK